MKVGCHDRVASGRSRAMRYREGSFIAGGPGPPGNQRVLMTRINDVFRLNAKSALGKQVVYVRLACDDQSCDHNSR